MADSPEKRIKDLEERMKNAEIRHKRLKSEQDTAISGLMKTLSKHQRDTYDAFRRELKAATDAERKNAADARAHIAREYKALTKDMASTQGQIKKHLR